LPPVVELAPPLVKFTLPALGEPALGEPAPEAMPVLAVALPSVAWPPSAAPPLGFNVASASSALELQLATAKIINGNVGHKSRLSMGYRPADALDERDPATQSLWAKPGHRVGLTYSGPVHDESAHAEAKTVFAGLRSDEL
jgi:hypothetical protein